MSEQLEIIVKYKGSTPQQWAESYFDLAATNKRLTDEMHALYGDVKQAKQYAEKANAELHAERKEHLQTAKTAEAALVQRNAIEDDLARTVSDLQTMEKAHDELERLYKQAKDELSEKRAALQHTQEHNDRLVERVRENVRTITELREQLKNRPGRDETISLVRAIFRGFLPAGSNLADEAADRIKEMLYGNVPPRPLKTLEEMKQPIDTTEAIKQRNDPLTALLATAPCKFTQGHSRRLCARCDVGPCSELVAGVNCAPGVAADYAKPVRQYYYRNTKCSAETSKDESCICWHDQGTGNYPQACEGAEVHGIRLHWRDKPQQ